MLFFFNDTATTEIYTLSYTTLFRSRAAVMTRSVAASAMASASSTMTSSGSAAPDGRGSVMSWSAPRRGRGPARRWGRATARSEEHTSELQLRQYLVCRLLLEKKNNP